jgi:transcriptional regulator with XRE-family HTH domain
MADVTQEAEDFGTRLRVAREARGLSLREIAESTKIATAVLEALESSDIAALPGGIFGRSFVRAYAGAVGLDPEKMVQAFLFAFPTTDAAEGSVYLDQPEDHDQFASQLLMTRTALCLFVLSVPIAAFLVFLGLSDGSNTDLHTPEAIIELGPPRAAGAAGFDEGALVGAAEEGSVPGTGGPLVIDIHPRESTWVSLTLDGTRVFSRVMQPGEHEVHEALHDIVINVGNAAAFNFSINQQQGQSLGAQGEVVTAHIDRDNYRRFLVQQAETASEAAGH